MSNSDVQLIALAREDVSINCCGACDATTSDVRYQLSPEQLKAIDAVPGFRDGPYGFLEPIGTLAYFQKKYVACLSALRNLNELTVADCGSGYGWNALALGLGGAKRVLGFDFNPQAVQVANGLARALRVDDRVEFRHASITELPLEPLSVDAFFCIETLEHLFGKAPQALREVARATRDVILVTTPNKWFPMIAHDTRLPFAHWLPKGLRDVYARALRREEDNENNVFVSPREIIRGLRDFRLTSRFLGFPSFSEYAKIYPHYLPYMGRRKSMTRDLRGSKRAGYRVLAGFGGQACFHLLPSLTGIFRRAVGPPRESRRSAVPAIVVSFPITATSFMQGAGRFHSADS